jgi:hypothetical protein
MSETTDWYPGRRDDQLSMAKTWGDALDRSGTAWGVPPEAEEALTALALTAEEVLFLAKNGESRTPVVTARCRTAFKALEDRMRDIKKRYFFVPPLTDADLVSLKLKPESPPAEIPAPTAQPAADLVFPGLHLVELTHIRPIGGVPPDPRADYGVRIFWGLAGEPTEADKFRVAGEPKKGSDLPHSVFTRRKKERFDFDGESGTRVYFCLRYENSKGGKEGEGPFGPILSAVIP